MESNRMSKTQVQEVASFTPKGWEKKIIALLREAKNARTIDGWWRDLDRSNSHENKRRMPGKLDFEVYITMKLSHPLFRALPDWKCTTLAAAGLETTQDITFTLYLEAKTGRGKPNSAQAICIERANRNPGAHAFVVYPTDLPWLRKVLAIA